MRQYLQKRAFIPFKLIWLSVVLLLSGSTIRAQNASQYVFSAQASTFTPITGTAVSSILGDDASSVMFPIGFNFVFCGNTYTQFMVSSNGWLSFINTGGNYRINQDPGQVASISPSLLPLWDDLDMGTTWGGSAGYTLTGVPGSQVLTMQWLNAAWDYAADAASISFQVKLYEGTNVIEFIYRQDANAPNLQYSGGATIGILRNPTDYMVLNDVSASPTTNTSTFIVGLSTRPATGQLYRFTPPAPCSGQPLAGTATAANTSFNCSGFPSLNLTGGTVATGITYAWESSPNGLAPWTPVPGASGLTNPAFSIGTAITATTHYRVVTTCSNGNQFNQSLPVQITVTQAIPPIVVTPLNINCGDAATLTATAVPNSAMNWFTTPTGGAPFASGTSVSVSPTVNTTYYAEKFFGVTAANTTAQIIDHDGLTGDDRGGIAVTQNYLYVTGDNNTARYDKNTLTGGVSLQRVDGIFSDIGSQTLYALGDASGVNTSYYNVGGNVDRIYALNETTLATTGSPIMLPASFAVGSYTTNRFIAAGYGFVIFYVNSTFYKVDLPSGTATTLSSVPFTFTGSESFASRGWATLEGSTYFVYYITGTNLNKLNLTTGTSTTVQAFSSLSDMASVTYNAATNRMYFHYEGGAQFGGSSETAGFLGVTSDNNCGGYGTRSSVVVNVTPPTVTVSTAPSTICLGQPTTTTFTGTPNSTVTYNVNGGGNQTLTLNGSGTFAITSNPTVNTTYNLVSVVSGTCSGAMTGSSSVTVNPRPNGQLVSNTLSVCIDQPASIGYSLSPTQLPITLNYTDGTNNYTANITSNGQIISVPSNVAGTFNYSITSITNQYSCAGIAGTDYTAGATASVLVNNRPTATITSAAPGVCPGGNTDVTITFTGTAPFFFEYTDGTTPTSPAPELTTSYTFNVTPTVTTTYSMTNLADGAGCIALPADIAGSATVAIWDLVAITTQPQNPNACYGTGTSLTVGATGSNLTYQWYEGATPLTNTPPYSGANAATLNISSVNGLGNGQYSVVVNGSCGGPLTSDVVNFTENFNNTWTGAVSSDWSNTSNWACGILPTSVTNAVIPDMPNDPIVDVQTAECKDLLIDANASVLFTGTNNMLSVYGNILNNGTLNGTGGTGGTVVLAGTTQSITGPVTLENLHVTGGNVKTLNNDMTIEGILDLDNGMLQLGANDLILSQPTTQTGGNPTSFIVTNGTGTVTGNDMGVVGGTAAPVTFHVGINNTSYTPVTLENLGDADNYSVRVIDHVYEDGTGVDPTQVDNPVVDRTWMVEEGTAGGSIVNMTPSWNAPIDEINGFVQTNVFVTHYMGGEWTSTVGTSTDAPAATPGMFPGMWMTTEDSITSFSPFAVASTGQFPLAIRLGSITATNAGARNKVQWKSETEDAGDVYELESSADGRKFTKIATVAAKGEASTYMQWDESPVQGVNYYRVKLLNNDGTYSYSKVVTATVKGKDGFSIEAYPNPVKNMVSVKVDGVVAGNAKVVVTDVTGKVIKAATAVSNNGAEINVSDLASGIYLLNYSDDTRNESIKITKQ